MKNLRKERWESQFTMCSEFPKGHYNIKRIEYPHTPLCMIVEPIGGCQLDGKNLLAIKLSNLIQNAPEMLDVLMEIDEYLTKDGKWQINSINTTSILHEKVKEVLNKVNKS